MTRPELPRRYPGHYETWAQWGRDRTADPALRAIARSSEYEDWPRGRIVFDRARDLFILYADRKLIAPETIAASKPNFICRLSAPRSKATCTTRAPRRRTCYAAPRSPQ